MAAKKLVNPPATLPSRAGDLSLEPEQLKQISLFAGLSKQPSFEKFPGALRLRRFKRGESIVEQGDAGWTAFYILKSTDEQALGLDGATQKAGATERTRAATAYLRVNLRAQRRGLVGRLADAFFGGRHRSRLPRFIANDGPADISTDTLELPMHEGELFGEMSCMSRAPRSATVVAYRDCYMLEMLRNVLDQVRKDPAYKAEMDKIYRERVLGGHLRQLSIFAELSDAQFEQLRSHVELIIKEPGEVIFDEDDPADAVYIIRSGLVKVVKNLRYLVRPSDFTATTFAALCRELAAAAEGPDIESAAWKLIEPAAQEIARSIAAGAKPKPTDESVVLAAINNLVKDRRLPTSLGKKKTDLLAVLDEPMAEALLIEAPEDIKEWSDVDVREFNRLALERMAPTAIPPRRLSLGDRRTLAYLGRGDFFGEVGVIEGAPRGATCIAYNHPDSGQAVASGAGITPAGVELARVGREPFLAILRETPRAMARVEAEAARRLKATARLVEAPPWNEGQPVMLNPRFEELGLIQGQKLMLIDLDRCTRCGDCVRACIATHDDGASRLFLDGPRFGKYLVPNACRKCLDPVCMIGCPVGSIVPGANGEIVIEPWCIGCGLCAEQCPYGSIHMNFLEDLRLSSGSHEPVPEGTEIKEVVERAVVCDLCSGSWGQTPACVYHCPHDAAIRIDARSEFPAG